MGRGNVHERPDACAARPHQAQYEHPLVAGTPPRYPILSVMIRAIACAVLLLAQVDAFLPSNSALALRKLPQSSVASRRTLDVVASASLGSAAPGTKVVVFGGTGFVGSRVVEQLVGAGCEVVSVSRSGTPPNWSEGEAWVAKASWMGETADMGSALQGAAAVVSCIGVIGGSDAEMQEGNGKLNCMVAESANKAGCPRFVYVSVSEAVEKAVGGFALKGYFAGKKEAEAKIQSLYPQTSVIVGPTFIYGGEEFGVTPPRVAAWYGGLVESVLSLGPVRSLASALLPSALGLALLPPVSVDAVASAAAGGALGTVAAGKLDGTDKINEAAQQARK